MRTILKYKKSLIALVLAVAAGAGLMTWRASSSPEPAYREETVSRGDLEVTILATGLVRPRNRLEIKPPIAGRVEQVLVREGQEVARGQLLAWMSSSERAALMDAARSKGPEELKRWEDLYRPTPVVAPLAGTVILRNAEPGQTFASTDAIIVMSDRLIVRAQVDETDIARARVRQAARITLDAYPDTTLPGVVEQIAFDAKAVNNVTTYEVDVLSEKIPPFMRSGMTANVSFVVDARRGVLLIPSEAIRTRGGKAQVLVAAAPDAEPIEKPIEFGLSDGKRTEVLSGLAEGDKILVPRLLKPSRTGDRSSPLAPQQRRR